MKILNGIKDAWGSRMGLYVIPCRESITPEIKDIYNESYNLWNVVWKDTLKNLDGRDWLFSDDFTRHDFATVITLNNKPISLMCYSEVDLSLSSRRNDSWFRPWPESYLNDRANDDGLGVIAAWFCTDPKFRKKSDHNLSKNISQALIEIYGKIILEGNYNRGYGITRNNRSVDKYSQAAGSTTVAKTIDHNCEVNLVEFIPSTVREKQKGYLALTNTLWRSRSDYYFNKKDKYESKNRKSA